MKLKFFKSNELDSDDVTVAVYKTGKLIFSTAAKKRFNLEKGMSISIGFDEDNLSDKSLYAYIFKDNKGDFKIAKAGPYHYVNTKWLFDFLKVNYKDNVPKYKITDVGNIEKGLLKLTPKS